MLLPCSVVSHRAITCYCPALWLLQSIMAYIAQSVPLIVWLQGLQILLVHALLASRIFNSCFYSPGHLPTRDGIIYARLT